MGFKCTTQRRQVHSRCFCLVSDLWTLAWRKSCILARGHGERRAVPAARHPPGRCAARSLPASPTRVYFLQAARGNSNPAPQGQLEGEHSSAANLGLPKDVSLGTL